MRLIDADELPREKMLAARGNGQYEDVDIVYGDDIDNAPTVDPVWDEIPVCSTEVIDGIAYINLKADTMGEENAD